MIKLVVDSREHADSVVPVRWCICKETLLKLRERGARNPHLLLSIVYKGIDSFAGHTEIERKLMPIDQMMEYVAFRKPGNYTLYVSIVYNDDPKAMKRYVLEKDSAYRYSESIFNYDNEFMPARLGGIDSGELDVIVGNEFFAKEPSELEKWWVNLWFEGPARDQCQFRRRRMVAYSFQLVLMPIYIGVCYILAWFVGVILFLVGRRYDDLGILLKPWNYRDDVFSRIDTRWYLPVNRSPFYLLATPIVLLVLWSLVYSFGIHTVLGALATLVVLIVLVVRGCKYLQKRAVSPEKKNLDMELWEQFYAREMDYLVCTGKEINPSLSALPRKKRTFRLRFQNLKSKVCKPFAR